MGSRLKTRTPLLLSSVRHSERPSRRYVILTFPAVWESLEAHQVLMNDKVAYPKLGEQLAKVGDLSKINMFHVHFQPESNLAPLLNAPFTSFAHLSTLKPGKTINELQDAVKSLVDLPKVEHSYGGAWGKAIEKDDVVLLYGWDDPKVNTALFSS
jgi:hypothetical protein